MTDDQTFRISWFQDNRNDVGYYAQSKLNPNCIPTINDPYEQRIRNSIIRSPTLLPGAAN